MLRYPPSARFPLACLLVVLGASGCMQSPQAAQADCRSGAEGSQWRGMEQELRAQGLALKLRCAGKPPQEGSLQLVVLDSVRASGVLRGPLADGENVELGIGANASPDVQFNRAWLDKALLRHRSLMTGDEKMLPKSLPVGLTVR